MKIHEVFPTAIGHDFIDCHEEFKEKYFEEIKNEWFTRYEEEIVGRSGKILFHLNGHYDQFFKSLAKSVEKYLILLGVDISKLNLHITNCWVGHQDKKSPPLKVHTHNSSDISFCYYLQSDESSDKFCVHPIKNYNEVTGGLFDVSSDNPITKISNKYNCDTYAIAPVEGSVIIFPSSLPHSTLKQPNLHDRYVIAGDIKITLKPKYYEQSQSIPHPTQWLDLERP